MEEKLKKYMESLVQKGVFPGACYAFYYQGKEGMGVVGKKSLFPKEEENSLDTIYDIASLTKVVVTNVLVAQAVEEGKLKLEDSYASYWENFPYPEVTLLHLLTHTSSLVPTYDKYHLERKEDFFTKIKLNSTPGKEVVYADINYILLGFLIEKLYGESLSSLATTRIFKPLHMKDTGYCPKEIKRCAPTEDTSSRGLLRGKVEDEKAYFLDGIAGHAGVFSTVSDIFRFAKMILKEETTILSHESMDCWFHGIVTSSKGVQRSHSWMIGNTYPDTSFTSSNCIFHTGFSGCELWIDKDQDFIFLLLSNRVHPTRENHLFFELRKEYNEEIYRLIKEG